MKKTMTGLAVLLTLGAPAFEPIVLPAADFARATGTPTLQMWSQGAAVVPVWSLSGRQTDQSVAATTAPLPADCRGVKIEILVVNNEASANDSFTDVYRVDVAELAPGAPVRATSGKPVMNRLAPQPWTPRWLEIESYVVVGGGAPLSLRLRREPGDRADTYDRPAGFVQMRVTPLPPPPAAFVVENRAGYNSWPMLQNVDGRLVCTYSRGSGHTIHEGCRDAFARTSADGGRTWTPEVCFARDPDVGEVMIGKGRSRGGAALFWVRCMGRPKSHHDLYRTRDGVTFEKIAEPALAPFPMQITDVFHVDGKLMALWFATRYRDDDEQSWGTLVSADDGRTWTQTTVETVTKRGELPTEPCVVNLGGGRLLGLARTEDGGDSLASQFQLTSLDGGATWKKTRTNIRDVLSSSPSLIYEPETDLVYNYYYERGRHVVKCRVAKAADVFDRPFDWPAPRAVLVGDEKRPHDAGNVNAVAMDGRHYLTYYSGTDTDTTVYVAPGVK
ncbi:MAG: sialidase family protein [Kiritimatiellia bacterium]